MRLGQIVSRICHTVDSVELARLASVIYELKIIMEQEIDNPVTGNIYSSDSTVAKVF